MDSCAFDKLFEKSVPHVLEKIFFSLDYESFKNCMDVNKMWHELLTSETFKTKAKAQFQKDITQDQRKLWYAAFDGNVERIKRLLSSGMLNINWRRG